MLAGVISDTHDNMALARRAASLFRDAGVDVVIHLGDVIAPFTLSALISEIPGIKTYLVFGNNDGERRGLAAVMAAGGGEALEPPAQLSLAGRRLLLLHGFGGPEETVEIVDALASGGRWDAVLYGHTHEARVDYIKGRLILNPGDGGGVLNKPTAALLDLESLRARLVSLEG